LKFEVPVVVKFSVLVFWVVMLFGLVGFRVTYCPNLLGFGLEDGGSMFSLNVGAYLYVHIALPKRPK
jgi:hypothetical protein